MRVGRSVGGQQEKGESCVDHLMASSSASPAAVRLPGAFSMRRALDAYCKREEMHE